MRYALIRDLTSKAGLLLAVLVLPIIASAEGAIGLLSPTHSTLVAGQPFSWMEIGSDWNGVGTHVGGDGFTYATPTLPQNVTIESWRTGTDLHFIFTIDDQTSRKPDMTSLLIGDKIIIQIDPNNSGHSAAPTTTLSPGAANNIATDYRFEIVIKDNLLVAAQTGFKRPEDLGGGTIIWGFFTQQSIATVMTKAGPAGYIVNATIPLSLIGSPANDVGIAMAVINDLGHDHFDVVTVSDLTGTVFPSSMGLNAGSDPGLIQPGQESGNWKNPASWGIGYFNLGPGDVTFSHNPSYVFSDALKLSVCDAPTFAGVGAAGQGIDQLTLTNWYQYYPNKPCQMKIWFRANKSGAGVLRRRFLIIWGRPGVAPQDWFVVTLTPPVNLSQPAEINSFVWQTVPAVNFTAHPCLRIYVLPENLNPVFDAAAINGIDTQAELNQMETTYGINPGADFKSAQMNFTALRAGSCPAGACAQAALLKRNEFIATAESDVRPPELGFGFGISGSAGESLTEAPAQQQVNTESKNRDYIRITANGIAFALHRDPNKPYTLIERLGGVVWAISNRDLIERQQISLELDVTNPAIMLRDFTASPPVDIKSPERSIVLAVTVEAPSGIRPPLVVLQQDKKTLAPGETTRAVLTVTPQSGPAVSDRFALLLAAGVAIPQGNFNIFLDPGFSFNAGIEHMVHPQISLVGLFGYQRFPFSFGVPAHLNSYQFTGNGRFYTGTGSLRGFATTGAGVYWFSPGTNHFGLNTGGGVQFMVTPKFGLEGQYNFHTAFTPGSNAHFSTVQGGVRFVF